jgi:hypothetical protein
MSSAPAVIARDLPTGASTESRSHDAPPRQAAPSTRAVLMARTMLLEIKRRAERRS